MGFTQEPINENQAVFYTTALNVPSLADRPQQQPSYLFDTVTSENIGMPVRLTRHPLDSNVNIADHAFTENIKIRFNIFITDIPVRNPSESGFNGGTPQDITLPSSATTYVRRGRARAAFRELKRLRDE